MASHSYKMHDAEKMFLGIYRSICTAKNDFWTISIKFLTIEEDNSFTMPYHFTHNVYQTPSMSIVSKLIIIIFLRNNKKNIGEKNVVSLSSKYTVSM